jgi:hypothetical protein
MVWHGRRSHGAAWLLGEVSRIAEPRPEAGTEGRAATGRAARWARTRGPRRQTAGRGRETPVPGGSKPLCEGRRAGESSDGDEAEGGCRCMTRQRTGAGAA